MHIIRLPNKLRLSNYLRWLQSRLQATDNNKLDFYRQFVSKGSLCFDIGANIGQKIEFFLKLGARVIAVEPQPACFSFLKRIYGRNKNVVLVPKAVDSVSGVTKDIYICEANALSSMNTDWIQKAGKVRWDYQWAAPDKVETITLDNLIMRFGVPTFANIDVEGFELNVVKGLTRKIPCLSLEISPFFKGQLKEILNHLSLLGELRINLASDPTDTKGSITFYFKDWLCKEDAVRFLETEELSEVKDMFVKMLR